MKVKLVIWRKSQVKSETFHDHFVEFYCPSLMPDEYAQVFADVGSFVGDKEMWKLVAIVKR